ncbi:MAG TPA: cupin domain-containing protein [Chitinophagaceae bacterium]|nr:cupin domain-containing protein [Chitinophagaceae bacterium]
MQRKIMPYHQSLQKACEALQQAAPAKFVTLMQHGTMSVEYYSPAEVDMQAPHKQDELYVIAKGSGTFFRNGERVSFAAGDVLFVPAGMEHRFENFTEGFATWVIFYGLDGGEQENNR